jgi:phosphoglycolate phosphatase
MSKSIIFDWSGVVRDTAPSQVWIVNRIFKKYGVGEITLDEFRENWEQPYTSFYKKYLPEGYVEEERVKLYRETLFDKDCPKSFIFTGMAEVLRKCKENGFFLAIVSSDLPETLLAEIKEWGLENIFTEIAANMDNKLESVQKIIEKHNLNLSDTFFVGDSNHEVDVAKEVGIKSIAVTWGFTSERKLRAQKPDYVAHNVAELENIIF